MTDEEQKQKNRERQKKYRASPGIKEKRNAWGREWLKNNRERYNEAKKEWRLKRKIEVLAHYSDGKLACAHCGYDDDVDALCLDHISDDGAEHRKEIGASGTQIYDFLHSHGWMKGLQVLCSNCNTIKELRRKRGGRTSEELLAQANSSEGWTNKKK
jgi:hypothetical protein